MISVFSICIILCVVWNIVVVWLVYRGDKLIFEIVDENVVSILCYFLLFLNVGSVRIVGICEESCGLFFLMFCSVFVLVSRIGYLVFVISFFV